MYPIPDLFKSLGENMEQKFIILIHFPEDSAKFSLIHGLVSCEPLITTTMVKAKMIILDLYSEAEVTDIIYVFINLR